MKITIPNPPKVNPVNLIKLFEKIGCKQVGGDTLTFSKFKGIDELYYQYFKENKQFTNIEKNILWFNLALGLTSKGIYDDYLQKYLEDPSLNIVDILLGSMDETRFCLLFFDTLFILDKELLPSKMLKLKKYFFRKLSLNHNRYRNISCLKIIDTLAQKCYIGKKYPSELTQLFPLLLTNNTKSIIINRIDFKFFNIYYENLSKGIKRLQRDKWYLHYFIFVENDGVANQTVVSRLEQLLELCDSNRDLELIIPIISDRINQIQGTRRLVDIFPEITEKSVQIIKRFSIEAQYKIFYKIAKMLYEHDSEISYSSKDSRVKTSDAIRLRSRVFQWINYLDQIEGIYIFLPIEGQELIKRLIQDDEYKFMSEQIINQIKTSNVSSEIVIIKLKNILVMETFRGHGDESRTSIYENVSDSMYKNIINIARLSSSFINNLVQFKSYEIKHGFLYQIESSKLLFEKFNIFVDKPSKIKRYDTNNSDFDSFITQSYQDSIKWLNQNDIPGGTNIVNCSKQK